MDEEEYYEDMEQDEEFGCFCDQGSNFCTDCFTYAEVSEWFQTQQLDMAHYGRYAGLCWCKNDDEDCPFCWEPLQESWDPRVADHLNLHFE